MAEDVCFFYCRLCVAVRRSAGDGGRRPRPDLPSFFFSFFHVRSGTALAARPGGRSLRRLLVEFMGASHAFCCDVRTRGEAPGRSLMGLFFFKRCIISPLAKIRRK